MVRLHRFLSHDQQALRATSCRPAAAPRPVAQVRRANLPARSPSAARSFATAKPAAKPNLPKISFEQMDAWITKRAAMVADYNAGKATMQDVANLAGFVKENSFTPELMQAAEKVQKLRQEGKNDEAAAALKDYDVAAEQAVAQRLEMWKRAVDEGTTAPLPTDKV